MINLKKHIFHCLIIVVTGLALIFSSILFLSKNLPSIEQLENYDPDLVTRIYSSDGKVLDELFVQKRVFTELNQIPDHMLHAVISSEEAKSVCCSALIRCDSVPSCRSMQYKYLIVIVSEDFVRNWHKVYTLSVASPSL